MKGVTRKIKHKRSHNASFNPHSQWREWRDNWRGASNLQGFNPHSQWREWQLGVFREGYVLRFQSTLPMKGVTCSLLSPRRTRSCFNPHSQWREWLSVRQRCRWLWRFNPHSQWREWHICADRLHSFAVFQSTLPMKGVTSLIWFPCHFIRCFNPHSQWREWRRLPPYIFQKDCFNPHSQWREWL